MNSRGSFALWLVFALATPVLTGMPIAARQNSGETRPDTAPTQSEPSDSPNNSQKPQPPSDEQSGAQPNDQGSENSTPDQSKSAATGQAATQPNTPTNSPPSNPPSNPADAPKVAPKPRAPSNRAYGLSANYSVELPPKWGATQTNQIPPPAPLGPYAPPFHLSGNLVLSDEEQGAILQFATSNNPFLGHDSYWLDTQIHSPSGSGMSLLDFFFYYFFPPSDACMHQVLTTYADASRVAPTESTPSYMQVYYACPTSDSLSGFYSAQVSSGITFRLTDDGTRVLAPVGDFYVAPMEELHTTAMTFFIFEAQGLNAVSSEAAQRFHLPPNTQGGLPDFFWAIGAATPFPFVADESRKDVEVLHVAYAKLGVGPDARAEFLDILHNIAVH